jgi:3-isopropylmalate dehydrogenase
MLLRWSLGQDAAADAIERAVTAALTGGYRTPDLLVAGNADGLSPVGTQAMGDAVMAALEAAVGGVAQEEPVR